MSLIPHPQRLFSWDPWEVIQPRVFGQLIAPDFNDILDLENALVSKSDAGLSEVKVDNNRFAINLDCHQFRPEELKLKLVDNKLVIHAKHEDRKDKDGGYSKREFTRTYLLPPGCLTEKMNSKLTDNGNLKIECPREVKKPAVEGRSIPIQRIKSDKGPEK